MPLNPPDRRRRDRALLIVYAVRQTTSLALLCWLVANTTALPDKRLSWGVGAATLGFAVWSVTILAKGCRKYRRRYPRSESSQ